MKSGNLARTVARETRQSPAEAQDEIDDLARKILRSLRQGRTVEVPGIGKLVGPATFKTGRNRP
jgi:nucleoid DNA-binding protein